MITKSRRTGALQARHGSASKRARMEMLLRIGVLLVRRGSVGRRARMAMSRRTGMLEARAFEREGLDQVKRGMIFAG